MPARRIALTALVSACCSLYTIAQDEATEEKRGEETPGEVTLGESASDQDPLAGREPSFAVEPLADPSGPKYKPVVGVPMLTIEVDPRVLGVAPGQPLPSLRREGEALRKRDGRLLPPGDRGYAVMILDPDTQAGEEQPLAMIVAPCMTLESMEQLQKDRGDDLRFTITGQVHTYRGINYLLPTSQPRPWLVDQEQPEEIEPQKHEPTPEQAPAEPDKSDVAEVAAEEEGQSKPQGTPSADDVLNQLLQQRRDAPAPEPAPTSPTEVETGDGIYAKPPDRGNALSDPLLLGLDPDQPQAELKEEGTFIIARTGRLIRSADGASALFVLDADKAGAPEPPLILHACRLLETMEQTVMEQGDDVPFVITGQVFMYRGANYLLPTIVKREFDPGNLE